jgi:pilus assembly protein CpaF
LNLEELAGLSFEAAREQAMPVARQVATADGGSLSLAQEILEEILGLAILAPLLKDDSISEILVNSCQEVYIERRGLLYKTDRRFRDDEHLLQTIRRIVTPTGGPIDESRPIVYARLADGSRVSAIIPPLAVDGPCLCIRRFGGVSLTAEELVARNSLSQPMLELLQGIVLGRLNVLISGGAASGKTTLLNALSAAIPAGERIITIEDIAELHIKQPHVIRLVVRPPDLDGKGAVRERQLVISSLRMRPDRIILGEVRGEEAFDMLQAMNTGHDGSLATLHANSPRDALSRVASMAAMAEMNVTDRSIRNQVASAIHVVVHLTRLSDGSRRVVSISEITGMEGDVISMQEIFRFERKGTAKGPVHGTFRWMGILPHLEERLASVGVVLRPDMFGPSAAG